MQTVKLRQRIAMNKTAGTDLRQCRRILAVRLRRRQPPACRHPSHRVRRERISKEASAGPFRCRRYRRSFSRRDIVSVAKATDDLCGQPSPVGRTAISPGDPRHPAVNSLSSSQTRSFSRIGSRLKMASLSFNRPPVYPVDIRIETQTKHVASRAAAAAL